MITVVDSGLGNIGSILNMLRFLGIENRVERHPEAIRSATRLILPGVGAFDHGMAQLSDRGLILALNDAVLGAKTPVLGICLGMQLMLEGSEEGQRSGLGWLKGTCVRFDLGANPDRLRIPHMGWNEVTMRRPGRLFSRSGERFYFVHAYHALCSDPADVTASARYGQEFTAAIEQGNIFGVQFHPEKSHRFGMRLLKTFAEHAP